MKKRLFLMVAIVATLCQYSDSKPNVASPEVSIAGGEDNSSIAPRYALGDLNKDGIIKSVRSFVGRIPPRIFRIFYLT